MSAFGPQRHSRRRNKSVAFRGITDMAGQTGCFVSVENDPFHFGPLGDLQKQVAPLRRRAALGNLERRGDTESGMPA